MTPERFALLPADRMNPLWITLSRHLSERLDILRRQNDASLAPEQTERLRGRIAQIKDILALADERPPVT